MTEIDKRNKATCLAIISNPNSTDEERESATKRLAEIAKWQAQQPKSDGVKKPYENKAPVARADYGKIPDSLQKVYEGIKPVFKGYFAMAATLVDEMQPDLDSRTRGQAVSAAVTQLVNLRLVEVLSKQED